MPETTLDAGGAVNGGTILGTVQETETIAHRVLVPPEVANELVEMAAAGHYTLEQTIARVRDETGCIRPLRLYHRWPVRTARPRGGRDHATAPLLTGQQMLDTFFPLLKGGKGAVPGPFGAGKTIVQHQIARWSNADIVIYVGCGERGNELADARHYPAVGWNDSFSGYVAAAAKWWSEHVDGTWESKRATALALLGQAEELSRIVNLVGPEALSPGQRWVLEAAGLIKECVLPQSAQDPVDSYSSPEKQFLLLEFLEEGHALLERKKELLTRLVYERLAHYREIRSEARSAVWVAYRWLSIAHMRMGHRKLRQVSLGLPRAVEVTILPRSNLGVEHPAVTARRLPLRPVGLLGTDASLDEARANLAKMAVILARIGEAETALRRLLAEQRKTQKRVNALRYNIIPTYRDSIRFIESALEEEEQDTLFPMKVLREG